MAALGLLALVSLPATGCSSVPNRLSEKYRGKTVYARYNVPITREVILDTWVGDVSGEFLPVGAGVDVVELTSDHLAVEFDGRTLFLLFRGSESGDSLGEPIERTFSPDPSATALQSIAPARRSLIRLRKVVEGMSPEEVRASWGRPPVSFHAAESIIRDSEGDRPDPIWLYPAGGAFHYEVAFVNGRVSAVGLVEGEGPLLPSPYPDRDPSTKRPYLPW